MQGLGDSQCDLEWGLPAAEPVPVASGAPFPRRPWGGWGDLSPGLGPGARRISDPGLRCAGDCGQWRVLGLGCGKRRATGGRDHGPGWKLETAAEERQAARGLGLGGGQVRVPQGRASGGPSCGQVPGRPLHGRSSPGGKAGLGLRPLICRDPTPEGCGGGHLPRPPLPVTATSTATAPGPMSTPVLLHVGDKVGCMGSQQAGARELGLQGLGVGPGGAPAAAHPVHFQSSH